MSEQTATDRLRELLDEHGVEHADASYKRNTPITSWTSGDSTFCFVEEPSKHTSLHIEECTPEQAIVATVGVGPCGVEVIDTGNEAAYEHYEHIMHCKHCNHEYGYVQYDEDGNTWMDEPPKFCPNCGRRIDVSE